MPLTPLHATAFAFLYFKSKRRVDPLALAVSTTFIDLEVLYYLLIGESLNHRMLHGFALALTVYPLVVMFGVYVVEWFFEKRLWSLYNRFRLNPLRVKYPVSTIYVCSLFGGFTHVFLDMFTHESMPYVFYPLVYGNPFYLGQASVMIEIIVILLSIYSIKEWLAQC
ncbi:hypothetical protein DRO44_02480 [Candidatus Bathyarchaeota archaeon]|nr:MAG: hypothetical protein DRO44_02480 [Candidatus Bathyarchaeota archaeon]